MAAETPTLAHELCHARFALDATYREAICALWEESWRGKLAKWMLSLGYHASRHADEFGAYLLTESPAFWRGRVPPEAVRQLRAALLPPAKAPTPLRTALTSAWAHATLATSAMAALLAMTERLLQRAVRAVSGLRRAAGRAELSS